MYGEAGVPKTDQAWIQTYWKNAEGDRATRIDMGDERDDEKMMEKEMMKKKSRRRLSNIEVIS